MRSTFHGLETAKRSLFTQQAALQTTGHNIANANTPGYSRQVVNMRATRPIEAPGLTQSTAPGQLGTGVEFGSITRIREKFLDDQFRNENKSAGSWSIRQDTLEKLEAIVTEPSDTGIRTVMENFWKSWSDLSKDPEKTDGRKIVRENALALADAFNSTAKQLSDLRGDLNENISIKSSDINSHVDAIASLNTEITRVEDMGDDANDLRDQRDLLTDELSKIINITVTDSSQGYSISMGAANLIAGETVTPVTPDSLQAAYDTGALNSGEVYGMIVSRDVYVADYQSQLDKMANAMANGKITVTIPEGSVLPDGISLSTVAADGTVNPAVTYTGAARAVGAGGLTVQVDGINGLHKLGYTFLGGASGPVAGGDFFSGNSASTFKVSAAIVDNPDAIATSLRTTGTGSSDPVIKGNNTLALLIGGLKDTKFRIDDKPTNVAIADYYRSVVAQLGVQSREATRQAGNQQILVEQVDSRRQAMSGVSLDEEMANMIKFQHAYSAAARVMTTMDQILEKIINGMGIVGR